MQRRVIIFSFRYIIRLREPLIEARLWVLKAGRFTPDEINRAKNGLSELFWTCHSSAVGSKNFIVPIRLVRSTLRKSWLAVNGASVYRSSSEKKPMD